MYEQSTCAHYVVVMCWVATTMLLCVVYCMLFVVYYTIVTKFFLMQPFPSRECQSQACQNAEWKEKQTYLAIISFCNFDYRSLFDITLTLIISDFFFPKIKGMKLKKGEKFSGFSGREAIESSNDFE